MARRTQRHATNPPPSTWTGELLRARNDYTCFEAGGMEWTVHRRLLPFLSRQLIPNWDSLASRPGLRLVKENRLRSVYCCPSDGGDVFIKVFRPKNIFARVKNVFVPSKAMTEWRNGLRCYYGGLPTAQPAFVGEMRQFGVLQSCTVAFFKVPYSSDFSPALDKARLLPQAGSDALRRIYATRLAELTDKLFQLRALHSDYHLGNILIDGADRLFVIDLNAVRFVSQVYPEHKLKVLSRVALSHAPFARKVRKHSRQEVEWLCESFAEIDPSLGDSAELLQKVLGVAAELEAIRLKSRDKRCMVSSSLYENRRRGSNIIYRRRSVEESDIEAAMTAPSLEMLHKSARGFVDVIEAPPSMAETIVGIRGGDAPKTIVRKRISNHRLKTLLDSGIRDSKGMRSWKAARALEVRELETALMFGLVETKKAGLFTSGSYLFMEHIQGAWMVHKYLEEILGAWPSGGAPLTTRFQFIRELAEFLARIQENGIRHHDLAVQNVLVRPQSEGGHELFLIDLDTVRLSALRRRDRIRNLVHFSDLPEEASSRDKLRFFKHYLENGGQSILEPELRKWGRRGFIQEISRRLDARMEAKRQRALKRANQ